MAGGSNAVPACSTAAVTGIGVANIQKAARIVFDAFTDLPSTASFCDARDATIAHATVAYAGAYQSNVEAAWNAVGVTTAVCAPPSGTIDEPFVGATIGGSAAVISGWATDLGGLGNMMGGGVVLHKDITFFLKRNGDEEFSQITTTSYDDEIALPMICQQNPLDPPSDECHSDADAVCAVTVDPNCPNIGWRAKFNTIGYPDDDYTLRVEARDFQGETAVFERTITIDNVNFLFSDGFELGNSSAWAVTHD